MSAMKLGALDFLSKPFEAEELFRLVEKALEPVGRDSSDAAELKRSQSVFNGLSTRERAVLAGVVAGKTNKIVAHELELSPRTVEVYRASLMMKTGATSLLELVRMALAAGLDDAAQ
jgi:two-component system response regulator FixJ